MKIKPLYVGRQPERQPSFAAIIATLVITFLVCAAIAGCGGVPPDPSPPATEASAGQAFAYRYCNLDKPQNQTKFLSVQPVVQASGAPCFASYEISFGEASWSCSCAADESACAAAYAALSQDAQACLAAAQ